MHYMFWFCVWLCPESPFLFLQASWYFCLIFFFACMHYSWACRGDSWIFTIFLETYLPPRPYATVFYQADPWRGYVFSLGSKVLSFLCTFLAVPRILTPGVLGYFAGKKTSFQRKINYIDKLICIFPYYLACQYSYFFFGKPVTII